MFANRKNKAIIEEGKIKQKRTSHKHSSGTGSSAEATKSASSKGGLLTTIRKSFRSRKGNRRKQLQHVNESPDELDEGRAKRLKRDHHHSSFLNGNETNNNSIGFDSILRDHKPNQSTVTSARKVEDKPGYFKTIKSCIQPPSSPYPEEGSNFKTSTPQERSGNNFQSEDIFKEPVPGQQQRNDMGFLKRKSSSKDKERKSSKPDGNEIATTNQSSTSSSTGGSISNSMDSMKRKLSFRRKKNTEETLNISDAELVFSTYSGTSIDHIEGTLKKRTKSPPPPQMAFSEEAKVATPEPSPQMTTAPVLMCESEPIKDEDIHELEDLLKAFSGKCIFIHIFVIKLDGLVNRGC